MIRHLIIILITIAGLLSYMYFFVGSTRLYKETSTVEKNPHRYDDPGQSIRNIHISAFYFIPKNKPAEEYPLWRENLHENLQKLHDLHQLVFHNRSEINFAIYDTPIVGLEENLAYDTNVTDHGNPEALKNVAVEIERRVLDPSGDLHNKDFVEKIPKGLYHVILIIYEGVGAAGSENIAFVSRKFLSNTEYQDTGASILAHEFYHTLGIPDSYELVHSTPFSEDIMGLGRERPFKKAFLERTTLRRMGL